MKRFSFLQQTHFCFQKAILTVWIALLLICAASCTKNLPDCDTNCMKVIFSGNVTDLTNNQPLKKVPIKVYLFPTGGGGFFGEKSDILAANGGTNGDGAFSFSPTINSGYFNTYTTGVNAYIPDGYLRYPVQAQSTGYEKAEDYASLSFDHYDSAAFSQLNFGFYEQTLLQIRAHRTSPVSSYPFVEMEYGLNAYKSDAGFPESEINKDTTISVYTGANAYTLIKAWTSVDTGYVIHKDSIRCTAKGPNVIDLYY